MANYNVRNGFKDIFGVYLLENLSFEGNYDMPVIENFDDIDKIDYLSLYSDLQDYKILFQDTEAILKRLLDVKQNRILLMFCVKQ